VNKNASILRVKTFLDEGICGCKVLEQVLIFDIVNINKQMLVGLEERALLVVAKNRDHVSDASLLHLLPPLERKEPAWGIVSTMSRITANIRNR
jgi:hypothetical protein